jgi:hypothetical protein
MCAFYGIDFAGEMALINSAECASDAVSNVSRMP